MNGGPALVPVLTPAAWAAREIPAEDHLLGELFSTTSRAIFAADTGLGKTMLAVAFAFTIHLGSDFLHWKGPGRRRRVLFVDGEMPRELMRERIVAACGWFGVAPPSDGLFFLSREDVENMSPFDTEAGQG